MNENSFIFLLWQGWNQAWPIRLKTSVSCGACISTVYGLYCSNKKGVTTSHKWRNMGTGLFSRHRKIVKSQPTFCHRCTQSPKYMVESWCYTICTNQICHTSKQVDGTKIPVLGLNMLDPEMHKRSNLWYNEVEIAKLKITPDEGKHYGEK